MAPATTETPPLFGEAIWQRSHLALPVRSRSVLVLAVVTAVASLGVPISMAALPGTCSVGIRPDEIGETAPATCQFNCVVGKRLFIALNGGFGNVVAYAICGGVAIRCGSFFVAAGQNDCDTPHPTIPAPGTGSCEVHRDVHQSFGSYSLRCGGR